MIFYPTEELLREQAAALLGGFPITQLGPEQERLIDVYREEYFRVASCTAPADRETAERAISALYESHGMEAPRFQWADDPHQGALKVSWLGSSLRGDLDTWPRRSLAYSLEHALDLPLKSLLAHLLRIPPQDSSGEFIKGSLDACWIAHHLYAADVLRVRYKEKDLHQLRLHDEIARSVGLWWPYPRVCICAERPCFIQWDGSDPPKLVRAVYRDGYVVEGK